MKKDLEAMLPPLRAFARSLCGNPTLADDLVQQTLLSAWANRDSFTPGTNLRAWLFRILRNHFYSGLRKDKRLVEDVDGAIAARQSSPPAQEPAVELDELDQALRRLSAGQREAVVLVGGAGCSYEEAAAIAGTAVGTIKSRVARARARLSELLGEDEIDITQVRPAPRRTLSDRRAGSHDVMELRPATKLVARSR